ncbi:MAG TPA: BlaI/MecI/CopY family transcriptional regulator [Clostridia bacterium]|nr:BlaI/MecI/CopY family transcriptional regulator [Clostridia bacterium]
MKERIGLSDTEWRLMQIIWEKSPRTYREICDAARPAYGWTKHAVISFLKRMEAKGAIRVEDAKPVKLYYPLLDKKEAIHDETREVLDRVYNGDILLMVQAATHAKELTEDETKELERLLREGKKAHD